MFWISGSTYKKKGNAKTTLGSSLEWKLVKVFSRVAPCFSIKTGWDRSSGMDEGPERTLTSY